MTLLQSKMQEEKGAAGKAFLMLLGVLAILGIAGFLLWQPFILPLVGEALPQRVASKTTFNIPAEEPLVSADVSEEWIFQRGLLNKENALIQTPDLRLQIKIETWKRGTAPSLEGAMLEVADLNPDSSTPRHELLSEKVLFYYTFTADRKTLIGAIGPVSSTDISAKSHALLTVSVEDGNVDAYLPTLATFLATVSLRGE